MYEIFDEIFDNGLRLGIDEAGVFVTQGGESPNIAPAVLLGNEPESEDDEFEEDEFEEGGIDHGAMKIFDDEVEDEDLEADYSGLDEVADMIGDGKEESLLAPPLVGRPSEKRITKRKPGRQNATDALLPPPVVTG